jgi:hypothetical protein
MRRVMNDQNRKANAKEAAHRKVSEIEDAPPEPSYNWRAITSEKCQRHSKP